MTIDAAQLEAIFRKVLAEQTGEVEDFWSAERVSRYLGDRSVESIKDAMLRGKLRSVKGGPLGSRMTKRSWVDEFIAAKESPRKGKRVGSHL